MKFLILIFSIWMAFKCLPFFGALALIAIIYYMLYHCDRY